MFDLRPSDLAFLDARARFARVEVELPAPPDTVFAVLADQPKWHLWCADLIDATWLPQAGAAAAGAVGVGSVRRARFRFATFEERILAWESGRRFSFSIDRASAPIARRAAEDWRLLPSTSSSSSSAGSVLEWHLVVDVAPLAAVAWPAAKKVAELAFRRTAAGLARYLAAMPPPA